MAATVFISYARKDASLGAAPLDAALRPQYATWRDTRGIDPAQDFTAEIEKAIQAASHVVVCVTPDVLREDSFVRREIAYANTLRKPILVARFAEVLPPIHIFTHTWVDFFAGWDAAFERLCHWLGGAPVASSRTIRPTIGQLKAIMIRNGLSNADFDMLYGVLYQRGHLTIDQIVELAMGNYVQEDDLQLASPPGVQA
jgi:hypothetical protein